MYIWLRSGPECMSVLLSVSSQQNVYYSKYYVMCVVSHRRAVDIFIYESMEDFGYVIRARSR